MDTNIPLDVCFSYAFAQYGEKSTRRFTAESCRIYELLERSGQEGYIVPHAMSEARNICNNLEPSDLEDLGLSARV